MHLGLDIGTTRIKMSLVDEEMRLVEYDSMEVKPDFGRNGEAEIDPKVWIDSVVSLLKRHDLSSVESIGLSGQMHSVVLLDEDFNPVRKAVLWMDSRGEEEERFLKENYGSFLLQRTGNLPSRAFTLVKLMFILKEAESVKKFCMVKDFIGGWLTGNYDTDFTDASATLMLDIHEKRWLFEFLREIHIPEYIFPKLNRSRSVRGYLKKEIADSLGMKSGIPVVYGAGDQEAAAFGVGVVKPGKVMLSFSTGSQIVVPVSTPVVDEKIHNFIHVEGYHIMGAVQNAGLAISWASEFFGFKSPEDLSNEATRSPFGSNGVVFIPYITPERTPLMLEKPLGALVNFKIGNSRKDLARAVLEGVTICVYDAWKYISSLVDVSNHQIILVGGAFKSDLIREMFCSFLKGDIRILSGNLDPSSFGAALMPSETVEPEKVIDGYLSKLETAKVMDMESLYDRFLSLRRHLIGG